jgi:hypothetical protein
VNSVVSDKRLGQIAHQSTSEGLSAQPLEAEAERKRQELGAAMEEELHQIVSRAGQANSSSSWRKAGQLPLEETKRAARSEHLSIQAFPAEAERKRLEIVREAAQANSSSRRKADQLPREKAKKAAPSRTSNWPWIMSLVVLIVVLAGVGYRILWRSHATEKPEAEGPVRLGLKIEMREKFAHITWDKNTPLLASAKSGVLSIRDGTHQSDLNLDANLLLRGSVNYYHTTEDVTFHLQVVTDNGKTLTEIVQAVGVGHANSPVTIDLDPHRLGGATAGRKPATGGNGPALTPVISTQAGVPPSSASPLMEGSSFGRAGQKSPAVKTEAMSVKRSSPVPEERIKSITPSTDATSVVSLTLAKPPTVKGQKEDPLVSEKSAGQGLLVSSSATPGDRIRNQWAQSRETILTDAQAGLSDSRYLALREPLFKAWLQLQAELAHPQAIAGERTVSEVLRLIDQVYGYPGYSQAEREAERQTGQVWKVIGELDKKIKALQ